MQMSDYLDLFNIIDKLLFKLVSGSRKNQLSVPPRARADQTRSMEYDYCSSIIVMCEMVFHELYMSNSPLLLPCIMYVG